MHETFDPRQLVDKAALHGLMARTDRAAAVRLAVHLALFVAAVVGLGVLAVDQPWLVRAPAILVVGFLLFSLYAPFHEATHLTAFRSRRTNLAVAWVTGVFYGYSPGVHADFHFTHHRLTNGPGDPEKGFSLPEGLPLRTPLLLVAIGALGTLPPVHSLLLVLAPTAAWDRLEAAWIRPDKRAQRKRASAVVVAAWVAGVAAGWLYHPTLLLDYGLALLIARTIHAGVTISEHEGMPVEGHQVERTRTVKTNPVMRFFWWNMNYHAEHHAWPAVPFHQLPALHALVAEKGVHTERGYLHFYLRRGYSEGPTLAKPSEAP